MDRVGSMVMGWTLLPTGGGKPRIEAHEHALGWNWHVFVPVAGPDKSYRLVYAGRASTWEGAMDGLAHWYEQRNGGRSANR